ncbi:Uma2 family endonuclease [Phormidesmis priestleyi ULC007]|uniref:Uma2 family endonuclease n=1 Tax=Phormidesmis priestleyi ULC007 TaxID=1920490 RepID=A0A2T1D7G0_9CYAN|nr:Uma2 family endonuclease [Phormidesmis priestleyi]PSB16428.1 Uma2 family endonuclease [Phormidesmis priestleyi ULC007]PZO47338.1 MAG: Uma2 family endonuclease [Phormidesmis priestleyi]
MTAQTISTQEPLQEKRDYTPEEYLELEEKAECKSEYDDGIITPMTGGTTEHNQIAGNCYIALSIGLKRQSFRVFFGDVRLWIPKTQNFKYPDVMVVAGEPEYYKNRRDTIINPQVIIEVLSDSTEAFDRSEKFRLYQTIPTFQEYILVNQSKVEVDQFFRIENKRWSLYEYDREDAELTLKSFELLIPILDIYDKVNVEKESK